MSSDVVLVGVTTGADGGGGRESNDVVEFVLGSLIGSEEVVKVVNDVPGWSFTGKQFSTVKRLGSIQHVSKILTKRAQ